MQTWLYLFMRFLLLLGVVPSILDVLLSGLAELRQPGDLYSSHKTAAQNLQKASLRHESATPAEFNQISVPRTLATISDSYNYKVSGYFVGAFLWA